MFILFLTVSYHPPLLLGPDEIEFFVPPAVELSTVFITRTVEPSTVFIAPAVQPSTVFLTHVVEPSDVFLVPMYSYSQFT